MELTPQLILAIWVGGMAGGAAVVAAWRVVGPGYVWLTASIVVGLGLVTAAAGGGAAAVAASFAAALALPLGRHPVPVFAVLTAATVGFVVVALVDSPALPAVIGTFFLGSVTSEMVLGHWFLVDPRLPRWPLFALAGAGGAALFLEVGYVALGGWITTSGEDAVFGLAYLMLAGFTAVLIAGVWFSLREPRYSGVMAATGLSYLAVLTSFGVVTLGRALVVGGLT